MKKKFAVMVVAAFVFCAVSFAQAEVIARSVTVKGDAVRGPLVSGLVNAYVADTKAVAESDATLGEYVFVTGPGGSEKIHFSPKLVVRLQKLQSNPKARFGLMSICPTQAGQLIKTVGPLRVSNQGDVKITMVSEEGKPKAILEGCKPGSCWVRNPMGTYWDIGDLGGVSVVGNINNPRYSENNVSAKMQVEGGKWVKKSVIRNQLMATDAILQIAGLQAEMAEHFSKVSPLVVGKPGKEGDSCYEKTWKIREDGKYFVLK